MFAQARLGVTSLSARVRLSQNIFLKKMFRTATEVLSPPVRGMSLAVEGRGKRNLMRTKQMKTQLLIASLIAGLAVTSAYATPQGGDRPERPTFQELDTDGDGSLSQAELQAPMLERFSAADTDGDGGLSVEEMTAAAQGDRAERMQNRVERMFERQDANEDGVLQMDEMGGRGRHADAGSMFDRLDADEDGAISEDEFDTAQERRGERGHGRHGGKRDRG